MTNNPANGFEIGEIVFEKYEILNFIAEGGGGRVYKAHDTFRKIDVAIKVLLVDRNDQRALVRFQTEAKTASKLSHPNIATIYDFGLWEEKPILVMEYVDGESLHDILKTEHTLELSIFYEIFVQVARAISHAHKSKIVHRDLKPANIIISTGTDGRLKPKVLDFGIAKSLDTNAHKSGNLTIAGSVIGSPLYMSPEQADGGEVTLESDLYSLGAIMYCSLAGAPPIQGAGLMETIMLVRTSIPPSISEMVDNDIVPKKLCALIDGMLSKAADQRPSLEKTVIPTLVELKERVFDQPEFAESDTVSGAPSWFSRNKKLVILSALALVIFDTAGLWVYSFLNAPIKVKEKTLEPNNAVMLDEHVADHVKKNSQIEPPFEKLTEKRISSARPPKLKFVNCNLTDADLLKVPNPELFKDMELTKSMVSSLVTLKAFTGVRKIYLGGTPISDKSLTNLRTLHRLADLDLKQTPITDQGLQHLTGLTHLTWLNLDGTKVSAKGIQCLSSLTNLRKLYVMRSDFDKDDVRVFAKVLAPYCTIGVPAGISDAELEELATEFPDLAFNEKRGQMFSDQELAESLLKPPNTTENYVKALELFQELITRSNKKFGPNSHRARDLYLGLGKAQAALGDSKHARESYVKAMSLSKLAGDKFSEFISCDLLLRSLLETKPDVHTLKTLFARSSETSDAWYGVHSGEAMAHRLDIAGLAKGATSNDVALPLFERALKIEKSKTKPDVRLMAYVQANIGDCYYWLHQPEKAKSAYATAAKLFESVKDELKAGEFLMYVMCYRAPTELAMNEGNFQVARQLNDKAIKLCASRKQVANILERSSVEEVMLQKHRIQQALTKK